MGAYRVQVVCLVQGEKQGRAKLHSFPEHRGITAKLHVPAEGRAVKASSPGHVLGVIFSCACIDLGMCLGLGVYPHMSEDT